MLDTKEPATAASSAVDAAPDNTFHYARRGSLVADTATDPNIDGYDAERMRARALLSADEEKKLLRKIDWHLMTLCSVMFLLKNIDADNVSNARVMNKGSPTNIMKQLGMTSDQYNMVTTLYYIPLLPSRWQSRIMVTWGIALACHAAVTNKEGLYAARFFLGLMEAGLFPGVILQMCYWYRPDEMSVRLLYFCKSGWQWIFLVEGIITIAFGIAMYWIFPDFPPQAKWLTEKEKAFIQARLPGNAPQAAEMNFNWREIVDSLKDIRLWLFTLIWALFTIGNSGVRFYQPTVIADLGYTDVASAQLLNLPISIFSIIVIGVTGAFADNGRLPRPIYPLSFLCIILACYGTLYAYPSTGGVFAATLIGNGLASAWFPMMWPWRVQTTSKATGSAFSIGFVNSYGQIGGAIGPHLFQSKYAPHYGVSFGIAMGFISASIVATLGTWWLTRQTEQDTRRLKLARVKAQKRGETVLDDVVDSDLKKPVKGGSSSNASA
ncbi:MFS general substrate transporter [Karstenula rhodostoma CBS 690.94]|uniref:MFS general substrate transporter n=1 Tax=Karstenula rhodostoma CBS 690.94 TaxID=1392251 RepID=A0A9P4UEN8_9PLEO|nr:MFS general substrate transporter [Karstenula rhodostoma CBS 690.94]